MKKLMSYWSVLFIVAGALFPFSRTVEAESRNLAVSPTQADKRVALVIGNGAYSSTPLRNPVNDAHDMAVALRGLGFQVIERSNATQKEMNKAIIEFGEKLSAKTVALFYYAGHGVQVRGKNFLIPVDATISSETAVRAEGVDVDTVLDQLSSSPLNIVILDACRNNPFESKFRSAGGGLAQIEAPKGTLIAYATAPGKTAADGDGRNGVYTRELLKAIQEPGLPIEQMFKHVRAEVTQATGDAQTPWESSSLTGDFYFKGSATTFQTPVIAMGNGPTTAPERKPVEPPSGQTSMFKDCDECPAMVAIPIGTFMMGSDEREDEKPIHKIVIRRPFAIGRTEVTQGQWKALMGTNPSKFPKCGDDCPVENVTWFDAQHYINALKEKTGKSYRLPSESEWEYACKAGKVTQFCGGENENEVGWSSLNSQKQTLPVAGKKANAFGLYDMSGNVWEWVQDKYFDNYIGAPADGNARQAKDKEYRVLRGGSWYSTSSYLRASGRNAHSPEFRNYDSYGFRVARDF